MNSKIVYPKLSYKIIGCLFEVFKEIGFGHREKFYQNALAQEFLKQNISFQKEVFLPLNYKSKNVGKVFLIF